MARETPDVLPWCVTILLALIVIAVFWPAVGGGFTNGDSQIEQLIA
jgi:hypothetical protein